MAKAVYQSLLQLTWVDKLLDNLRLIFVDLYGDQLRKPHTTVVECDTFGQYYEQQVKELESSQRAGEHAAPQILVANADAPSETRLTENIDLGHDRQHYNSTLKDLGSNESSPNTSRPSTPSGGVLTAGAHPKGASRKARKQAAGLLNMASSGDDRKQKPKKETAKKLRRWDDSGMATEDDGTTLDYSADINGAVNVQSSAIDASTALEAGTRTKKGQYVLKDVDSEVHSILQHASEKEQAASQQLSASSGIVGTISGLFKNVVGGKVLTAADLDKPLKGMEEHLLKKNVAREAVVRLCDSIKTELIGVKTGSFECEA